MCARAVVERVFVYFMVLPNGAAISVGSCAGERILATHMYVCVCVRVCARI